MSHETPARAGRLARELELRFAQDAKLARKLNNARHRLQRANDRLWWGLHPDGIATFYGEHPTAVEAAFTHNRSEILGASVSSREAEHPHWRIHHALVGYKTAAELRRELAAEVGELAGELIATLVAAGSVEQDDREADVHKLANPREGF
ncbi:MAG: hypothetical protein ACXVHQ_39390 [Solirubrobacteraceae bacterium]